MNSALYDKKGRAVAYIAPDYHETIYLWDGDPVAYLFEQNHIYGINGRHLAWFINGIVYNTCGERLGFTFQTCPVSPGKQPSKGEKHPLAEIRPKWHKPPFPDLTFNLGREDLVQLLRRGEVPKFEKRSPSEPMTDPF